MRNYRRGRGGRRGRADLEIVDHPFNAFSEVRHVEIDQQPHPAAAEFEVRELLRQAGSVRTLEQSRAQRRVDPHCGVDDLAADDIQICGLQRRLA